MKLSQEERILEEVRKFLTHTRKNRVSMAACVKSDFNVFLEEENSEFPLKFSSGMIKI